MHPEDENDPALTGRLRLIHAYWYRPTGRLEEQP